MHSGHANELIMPYYPDPAHATRNRRYLRGQDESQTNVWYGRFRAAGALDMKSGSINHRSASANFRSRFITKTPEKVASREVSARGSAPGLPPAPSSNRSSPGISHRGAPTDRGAKLTLPQPSFTTSLMGSFRAGGQSSNRSTGSHGSRTAAPTPAKTDPPRWPARMQSVEEGSERSSETPQGAAVHAPEEA